MILSGLFGEPTAGGARGMPAAKFLEVLYRTPGIKSRFDGIALHPYAVDAETLEELVEELHEVTVENHDRVPLYITEMGWGSQNDFKQVAFEQGIQGQVEAAAAPPTATCSKTATASTSSRSTGSPGRTCPDSCNFCDSVGLFRAGPRFTPKPAWRAFVALTGGRARP